MLARQRKKKQKLMTASGHAKQHMSLLLLGRISGFHDPLSPGSNMTYASLTNLVGSD